MNKKKAGNDVNNILASEGYSLWKALDEDGTNSAKFGERNDGGGTAQIMIPYLAASIQCLQAPSLRSGSPYYYLSVVFFYLSKLLWCLSVINSKDKNTYLKLRVNQVRKRSNKETFRALEQLQIYLHQGINITSKNKSIHTGRFEALCCHYRMIKTWFS